MSLLRAEGAHAHGEGLAGSQQAVASGAAPAGPTAVVNELDKPAPRNRILGPPTPEPATRAVGNDCHDRCVRDGHVDVCRSGSMRAGPLGLPGLQRPVAGVIWRATAALIAEVAPMPRPVSSQCAFAPMVPELGAEGSVVARVWDQARAALASRAAYRDECPMNARRVVAAVIGTAPRAWLPSGDYFLRSGQLTARAPRGSTSSSRVPA